MVCTRLEPVPSVTKPVDITLEDAPGSKKGCSLVTTAEGFANDLLRSKASTYENLSLHLPSKLFKSSKVGLLLCLLLLDLGEPSERFFFLGVDSIDDGLSVLTRPNRVTSEGYTRVGGRITLNFRFLLLSTFFPGLVGQGGQLLNLSRHKCLTYVAIKLLDTGIVSHPFLPTSSTFLVIVEQGHNVPASFSFLSRGRHNEDRTRRSK